jgi:hypothetical protein
MTLNRSLLNFPVFFNSTLLNREDMTVDIPAVLAEREKRGWNWLRRQEKAFDSGLLQYIPSRLCISEYGIIVEDQSFLWLYYSAPRPPPSPSLPSSSCLSFSVFLCVAGLAYWREREEEPNHTKAKKSGPLYIIQYSLAYSICMCWLYRLWVPVMERLAVSSPFRW